MKARYLTSLIAATAATTCLMSVAKPATAGQLYNGWNYGIDSFADGSGGEAYNIRGMAVKESQGNIFVALTGGTPLNGVSNSSAADGNIGWGDLFFNFTNKNFTTANNSNSLFGIRFAGTNDSGAATTGVYSNVKATGVATTNHGYSSLQQYYNSGWNKANTQGTDIPTKQAAFDYFGTGSIMNVIQSGTKVGNINMLTASDLSAQGLNFRNFGSGAVGSQTIGFSFSKELLGEGDYIANIFLECGNDGVALKGSVSVPEPTSTVGLAFLGLGAVCTKLGKRRQGKAIA
ncbi:XDD3 family exosortase-dependent surface protein [[Phormidium] sp. ETS-05]|uniref:XDD3 family exosortase-dependent surface protein n=1 Tax=[Phormidium] sp. ETS-05 TaxID=222819 RepID=UPI0018EECBBF|nr:XDD3 family exosortase-dependent surface protein [[Phormidium] sp. ETS-05]